MSEEALEAAFSTAGTWFVILGAVAGAFTAAAAAEANQKAEEERLARVKIEEKLAPRHLAPEQMARVTAHLKRFAGQRINVFAFTTDQETVGIANQIIAALQAAKWQLSISAGQEASGRSVPGALVEVKKDASEMDVAAAKALVKVLGDERLPIAGPEPPFQGGQAFMGNVSIDHSLKVMLLINRKP
jgi:hypothetical protein